MQLPGPYRCFAPGDYFAAFTTMSLADPSNPTEIIALYEIKQKVY